MSNPYEVQLSVNAQTTDDALTANGYDVYVIMPNLGAAGGRAPDFMVDSFGRLDEYTPVNPTQKTVVRGVVDKMEKRRLNQ